MVATLIILSIVIMTYLKASVCVELSSIEFAWWFCHKRLIWLWLEGSKVCFRFILSITCKLYTYLLVLFGYRPGKGAVWVAIDIFQFIGFIQVIFPTGLKFSWKLGTDLNVSGPATFLLFQNDWISFILCLFVTKVSPKHFFLIHSFLVKLHLGTFLSITKLEMMSSYLFLKVFSVGADRLVLRRILSEG